VRAERGLDDGPVMHACLLACLQPQASVDPGLDGPMISRTHCVIAIVCARHVGALLALGARVALRSTLLVRAGRNWIEGTFCFVCVDV
jgi:hypothetical protein